MYYIAKTYSKFIFIFPLLAVIIWSFNVAINRYAIDFIEPISLSFYRWLIPFLILTPFMLGKIKIQRQIIKKNIPYLAFLSFLGLFASQILGYLAAHYTSATNMGIINAFVPVFSVLLSYFFIRSQSNRWELIGTIISITGLIYILSKGQIINLLNLNLNLKGDGLMLLAVFSYAIYGIVLKKWNIQLPVILALYIQIFFVLIFHIPFIAYAGVQGVSIDNLWIILYAGIFTSLISSLLWIIALNKIGPNKTSIFMNLMPVFTSLISYFWLEEMWTLHHTIGTSIIFLGIYFFLIGSFNLDGFDLCIKTN